MATALLASGITAPMNGQSVPARSVNSTEASVFHDFHIQQEEEPATDDVREIASTPMVVADIAPLMSLELPVVDRSDRKPADESAILFKEKYLTNYPGTFHDRLAFWCPPNIRYQPLYFEDVNLERYGYHYGNFFQPAASAIHFSNSLTLLGPRMIFRHPHSCDYPLGFCRPGSFAPFTRPRWLHLR